MAELLRRVSWVAPETFVMPGGNEMLALARGALRVLRGEDVAQAMGPYIEKQRQEST